MKLATESRLVVTFPCVSSQRVPVSLFPFLSSSSGLAHPEKTRSLLWFLVVYSEQYWNDEQEIQARSAAGTPQNAGVGDRVLLVPTLTGDSRDLSLVFLHLL